VSDVKKYIASLPVVLCTITTHTTTLLNYHTTQQDARSEPDRILGQVEVPNLGSPPARSSTRSPASPSRLSVSPRLPMIKASSLTSKQEDATAGNNAYDGGNLDSGNTGNQGTGNQGMTGNERSGNQGMTGNLTDRYGMNENIAQETDGSNTVVGNKYQSGNLGGAGGVSGMGGSGADYDSGPTSGYGGNTASGMSGLNRTDADQNRGDYYGSGNTGEGHRGKQGDYYGSGNTGVGQGGDNHDSTGTGAGYSAKSGVSGGEKYSSTNAGLSSGDYSSGTTGSDNYTSGTTGSDSYTSDSTGTDDYSSGNTGIGGGGNDSSGKTVQRGGAGGFDQAGEGYA